MDFDDSPTTVTVTDVRILAGTAYLKGIDQNEAEFVATLDCGKYIGPLVWWAETVQEKVKRHGRWELTTMYDSAADEWFCRAGNYSIKSSKLSFHSVD